MRIRSATGVVEERVPQDQVYAACARNERWENRVDVATSGQMKHC